MEKSIQKYFQKWLIKSLISGDSSFSRKITLLRKFWTFFNCEIEIQSYPRDKQAELKFLIFQEKGRSHSAQPTPSKGLGMKMEKLELFMLKIPIFS